MLLFLLINSIHPDMHKITIKVYSKVATAFAAIVVPFCFQGVVFCDELENVICER
jgi:hypothetical protein